MVTPGHSHPLNNVQDKYDSGVVTDAKRLYSVLILFIPAAIYFILSSQKVCQQNHGI